MEQELMRQEYKDFIKRNISMTFIAPACLLVAVLILFYVNILTSHYAKLCEGIADLDYRYVIVSQEEYSYNSNLKFQNLNTAIFGDRKLNVNTYMQVQEKEYRDKHPMSQDRLAGNEIAVSKKVAEKIKVDVGDEMLLEYTLSDQPRIYTVKSIYEYIDDYYFMEENVDFSTVLVGYDDSLRRSNRLVAISFFNESEKSDYLGAGISYTDLFDVEYEFRRIQVKCLIRDALILGLYIVVMCLFLVTERQMFYKELRKYRYEGCTCQVLKEFLKLFRRIFAVIPVIITWVIMWRCVRYRIVWIGISSLLYGLFWIRSTMYEKAD